MNQAEFYTDEDSIVQAADEEFNIIVAVPASDEGNWDKQKYRVYDERRKSEILDALSEVYNVAMS